jgi:hypothetical protein
VLWIVFVLLLVLNVATGIRQEQREGIWSWSKFAFAISFAALELLIALLPINLMDPKTRYYMPVVVASFVVAALNFIWMTIVARRWKLPDGRTSLQAYRDSHPDR